MRKVKDRPQEIKNKIEAKEGFDLRLDLRYGNLSKRKSTYSVPCKKHEKSDKPGYQKLELVNGVIVYFNRSSFNDKVLGGKRHQNTLVIEGKTLKFVAFHDTALTRMLFDSIDALMELKELVPANLKPYLEWTEWSAYRAKKKSLRIRNYKHEIFYSDHAKNVDKIAAERNADKDDKKAKEESEKKTEEPAEQVAK